MSSFSFCRNFHSDQDRAIIRVWSEAFRRDGQVGRNRVGVVPRLALLFCLLPVFSPLFSQNTVHLLLTPPEREIFLQNIDGFRLKPAGVRMDTATFILPDSAALDAFCRDLLRHFQQKSYLTASLDSLHTATATGTATATATALFHPGPAMRWISLRPFDAATAARMEDARFREKQFLEKPLHYAALLELEDRLVEQAENAGYPFARVWLDSVLVDTAGGVSAVLRFDPGRFFTIKELKINGNLKLPAAYLPNYLGLRPGSPYNRAQVLRLRDQLRTLLFVETTGNPTVTFAGNGEATVNLFLQKKRASRFDFIIGLLPRPDAGDGKLLLTGSISAAFQNALNLGERFAVEFERFKPETQRLDVQAGLPYLLGSPFGVEGRLNIFRRDSTWVDAQGDLGITYLFTGGDYLKLLWENKSSVLQKVDTLTVLQTYRLPPNLDLRQNAYGLEAGLSRLDYRFNPRRGWAVQLRTLAGFNTVRRNSQIENLRDPDRPDFSFAALYDTVAVRSTRWRLEGRTETYLPFFQRTTLKLGVRGGGIFSGKAVYNNEQYRLGGNKLLRGFDEESLFATRYVVATAEVRLLLGLNSYLAAFADYGYLENVTNAVQVYQHPLGLGAGLNFETPAGIFGISLAVGRRDRGEALNFRAVKFHLGYVSLF